MLKLDGLDEACIGAVELPDGLHLVYSETAMVNSIMASGDMDWDDALEYYEFNTKRAVEYLGLKEGRPVIMIDREPFEDVDGFADRMEGEGE